MKSCSGTRAEDARGTGFGCDRDEERKTGQVDREQTIRTGFLSIRDDKGDLLKK